YIDEHKIQAGWTFLTGNSDELETLRLMLGFGYRSKAWDSDKSNHAAMVRFGNADLDRWAFCPALSKPQVIADYFLQLDWPKTWPTA
ncbi:MAG: SCO family protein, partial [Acidobacteriota bacterium]|nr:SCO family protein [Acidobacteriota bacterium]